MSDSTMTNKTPRGGWVAVSYTHLVVAESKWQRSREWDNVLGYYDPQARQIVLHELVLKNKTTWQANFAVALGEALLGRYIARKWWEPDVPDAGARTYNIQLRAAGERECYLGSQPLRRYLELAQMMPQPGRKDCYFRLIAEGSGFLPSGVLFGLTYAWMLANEFAPVSYTHLDVYKRQPGRPCASAYRCKWVCVLAYKCAWFA